MPESAANRRDNIAQVPSELERRKGELSDLIVSVLRRNPWLCYFQGYHDICQVFLLVLCPLKPPIATTTSTIATAAAVPVHILNLDGTPDGAALPPGPTTVPAFAPPMPAPPPTSDPAQLAVTATCLTRLSALRIRDFMLPSLSPAVAQLRLIPQIVALADPELWDRLRGTEPFFALSGTLTMFAHDVTRLQDIARLFDALLARGAVYSVYVFAQLVLARRSELLAVPLDEPDILHWTLSRLPQHAGASSSSEDAGEKSARQPPELDLDALVADAAELQRRYPPESLPSWRGGVVTTALALAGALNRAAAASAGARRGQGRGGSGSAYGTAALTISPSSVLKTAAEPDMCVRQTVRDGEAYFDRQVRELEAAEWREEKAAEVWVAVNSPAARAAVGISLAVAVGAVAYWISRR